jgi:hypothetical protein
MKPNLSAIAVAVALAGVALAPSADANTIAVPFHFLTESATVTTPLLAGDTLFLDTLVTTEVGALLQTVTFTVGPGVSVLGGSAAWAVSTAAGPGPRLVGVNIDILTLADTLVTSDTFAGPIVAGFAHSTFASGIGPGTYKMLVTGMGVRDSSLDVFLTFAVPEPQTYLMMLAGLAAVGFVAHRKARRGG